LIQVRAAAMIALKQLCLIACPCPWHRQIAAMTQAGSINLLKRCLEAKKLETEIIQSIIQPLQTIYALRSTGIAHAGRDAPEVNLQNHHRKLVEDCEKSMEQLAELIRSGFLDVSQV